MNKALCDFCVLGGNPYPIGLEETRPQKKSKRGRAMFNFLCYLLEK